MHFFLSRDGTSTFGDDHVTEAVARQSNAVREVAETVDPQAWLFLQRARFLTEGTCDPYAAAMLHRAGFLA